MSGTLQKPIMYNTQFSPIITICLLVQNILQYLSSTFWNHNQRKKVNFSEFRLVQIVCSAAACGVDLPQWNVASGGRVNESLLWAQSLSARHLALLMADSILLAGIRVLSRVRLNLRSCLVISYMTNHQYYLDPHNFISLFHIFEYVLTFQVNFCKYFQYLQCRTLRHGLWGQVHLDVISGSII